MLVLADPFKSDESPSVRRGVAAPDAVALASEVALSIVVGPFELGGGERSDRLAVVSLAGGGAMPAAGFDASTVGAANVATIMSSASRSNEGSGTCGFGGKDLGAAGALGFEVTEANGGAGLAAAAKYLDAAGGCSGSSRSKLNEGIGTGGFGGNVTDFVGAASFWITTAAGFAGRGESSNGSSSNEGMGTEGFGGKDLGAAGLGVSCERRLGEDVMNSTAGASVIVDCGLEAAGFV